MEKYLFKLTAPGALSADPVYRVRHAVSGSDLDASILRLGVVVPVLVSCAPERYVVAGHRRLEAALRLGLKEIPVLEIREALLPRELFLAAVISNWNQPWLDGDRLSVIERGKKDFGLVEPELLELLPALGLVSEKHVLSEYLETAGLDPAVKNLIAAGLLPFRGARQLGIFSAADQRHFAQAVSRAALTSNQLMKAVEWLGDLAASGRRPLFEILAHPGVREALMSEDRKAAGEKLLQVLRAERFPRLVEREKEFQHLSGRFTGEERDLTLEAPPQFEAEGVTLRARFRDAASVERLLGVMGDRRKLLSELLEFML